jgi:uncharacterized protein YerC
MESEKTVKRRKLFSVHQKLEIIEKVRNGVSRHQIMDEYGLSNTSFYKVRQSAKQLSETVYNNPNMLSKMKVYKVSFPE